MNVVLKKHRKSKDLVVTGFNLEGHPVSMYKITIFATKVESKILPPWYFGVKRFSLQRPYNYPFLNEIIAALNSNKFIKNLEDWENFSVDNLPADQLNAVLVIKKLIE